MPFLDILIIPMKMEVWAPWFIENQLIQTFTYSGTAITQWHLNIVWLALFIIELNQMLQPSVVTTGRKYLQKALQRCKYPAWVLNRVKIKSKGSANKKRRGTIKTGQNNNNQKPYMVVPYYRGLSESLKKVCSRHGVQVYFKGGNTIKNLLVAPKDQDPILKKSGVIYRYKCDRVDCDEDYIGESSRERGSRNIRRHSPQYLTILTPLVIVSPLIILV